MKLPPAIRLSARRRAQVHRSDAPLGSGALVLLFACGGLLAALLLAPAAWLGDWVSRATEGRVQLYEPRGRVWRGSAVLVLSGGSASTQAARLPERVNWEISPRWSGLALSANATCCATLPWKASVKPHWGGFDADLEAPAWRVPATVLQGLGTPWNTLGLQGQLQLASNGLSIRSRSGRMDIVGDAQLDVLGASSKLSTLNPIGSYRIALRGSQGQASQPGLDLSTLEGALALSGTGQWIGQRLRFVGRASVADARHEAALQNILNIVGRRDGASSIITIG